MTTFHYYASNTYCYSKGATAEHAVAGLEVTHFPSNTEKEMPVSIIKVMEPIDKAYSINSYLPEGVNMIVEAQDYESNITLNELCLFEDGIIHYGAA